jgi:hypothetical protein
MTLAEILARLDELDGDLTIYTAISPYARADTDACVARRPSDGTDPEGVTAMGEFLDVAVAREVVEGWKRARPGRSPTMTQVVNAAVHFAIYGD